MSESNKSLAQVEQERLTRRAALRKLGFGAGLSAFMLLGVDDLARMVGNKMAQAARDNKTAELVAKEFQSAGVAFADSGASGSDTCPYDDCTTCAIWFYNTACAKRNDKITCCQQNCNDCCTPTKNKPTPCGASSEGVVTACHTKCAGYGGTPG